MSFDTDRQRRWYFATHPQFSGAMARFDSGDRSQDAILAIQEAAKVAGRDWANSALSSGKELSGDELDVLIRSGMVLVHGSPSQRDQLSAGSMLTDSMSWAAGYTTKSDWSGRHETITGKLHVVAMPTGNVKVFDRSLHGVEDELIKMAKALPNSGSTLKDAAEAVHKATGLDALIAKRNGRIVGAIILKPSDVLTIADPASSLRTAKRKGEMIASNMEQFLK